MTQSQEEIINNARLNGELPEVYMARLVKNGKAAESAILKIAGLLGIYRQTISELDKPQKTNYESVVARYTMSYEELRKYSLIPEKIIDSGDVLPEYWGDQVPSQSGYASGSYSNISTVSATAYGENGESAELEMYENTSYGDGSRYKSRTVPGTISEQIRALPFAVVAVSIKVDEDEAWRVTFYRVVS